MFDNEQDEENSLQRILAAMNDNKQVEETQRSADKMKMWAGIGESFGDLVAANAGARKPDYGSAFEDARKAQDQRVVDAKAAQKQKVDNLVTADKIGRMQVERGQEDAKHGWEAELHDPASPRSTTVRTYLEAKHPELRGKLKGMSAAEMKDFVSNKSDPQFKPRTIQDTMTGSWFNVYSDGRTVPINPPSTATADSGMSETGPVPMPGENPTQFKARRDAWAAGERKRATDTANAEQKAIEAGAEAEAAGVTEDYLMDLYDRADKEKGVGLTGRARSYLFHKAGQSYAPATDELDKAAKQYVLEYMKSQIKGTPSDRDLKFIEQTTPGLHFDRENFAASLKAAKAKVDRYAAQREAAVAKERPAPSPQPSPQPSAPAPVQKSAEIPAASKTVVKRLRNKNTGEVKVIYSDGTEEIVSGK
jgi:hypothetical protein